MKIALISDIHDNIWNLAKACKAIEGADVLLCLGDLCSPFIIPRLAQDFPGKPIHIILGNNDGDLLRIARNAAKFPNIHLEGEFFQGDLGGMKIAAVHYDNLAEPLVDSGNFDMVCYGHNHLARIEKRGDTLVINPGTIMGYDPIKAIEVPATYALLNTENRQAMLLEV